MACPRPIQPEVKPGAHRTEPGSSGLLPKSPLSSKGDISIIQCTKEVSQRLQFKAQGDCLAKGLSAKNHHLPVPPRASGVRQCSGQRASRGCRRGAQPPTPTQGRALPWAPKTLTLLCLGHPQGRGTSSGTRRHRLSSAPAHEATNSAPFPPPASPLQLKRALRL